MQQHRQLSGRGHTARKQSKNISQQKLTIGLDLGDRNSWYCVLDESGPIQREQRVRTNATALREVFGEMARSRIALEMGTHSPWISRLLSELGHEVMVANARKVRLIGESRKKDDSGYGQKRPLWTRHCATRGAVVN
jgi:transposase